MKWLIFFSFAAFIIFTSLSLLVLLKKHDRDNIDGHIKKIPIVGQRISIFLKSDKKMIFTAIIFAIIFAGTQLIKDISKPDFKVVQGPFGQDFSQMSSEQQLERELTEEFADKDRIRIAGEYYRAATNDFESLNYTDAATNYEKSIAKIPTLSSYLNLSLCYLYSGDLEKAKYYINTGIDIAKKRNKKSHEAAFLTNQGLLKLYESNLKGALDSFLASLSIVEENNLLRQKAVLFSNVGLIYFLIGDFEKASAYVNDTLKLSTRVKFPAIEANSYNLIGLIKEEQEDHDAAMEALRKSLDICEANNILLGQANAINNLGLIYKGKGLKEDAEKSFLKGLAISQQIKYIYGQINGYLNLSSLYYTDYKPDYSRALKFADEALSLNAKFKSPHVDAFILDTKGNIFFNKANDYKYSEDLVPFLKKGSKEYQATLDEQRERDMCLKEAAEFYLAGLKINYKIQAFKGQFFELSVLGDINKILKHNEVALDYFKRAMAVTKEFSCTLNEANSLRGIYEFYLKHDLKDEALAVLELLAGIYRKWDKEVLLAKSTHEKANIYFKLRNYPIAYDLYKECLALYEKYDDYLNQGIVLGCLAGLLSEQYKLKESLEYSFKAEQVFQKYSTNSSNIFEKNYLDVLKAGVLSQIARVYVYQGKLLEAKFKCESAYALLNAVTDIPEKGYNALILGEIHIQMNDDRTAEMFYEKARDLFKNIDDESGIAYSMQLIGRMQINRGNMKRAEESLEGALRIFRKKGLEIPEAMILTNLATVNNRKGDNKKAVAMCNLALDIFVKFNDEFGRANVLEVMGAIDSDMGNKYGPAS